MWDVGLPEKLSQSARHEVLYLVHNTERYSEDMLHARKRLNRSRRSLCLWTTSSHEEASCYKEAKFPVLKATTSGEVIELLQRYLYKAVSTVGLAACDFHSTWHIHGSIRMKSQR